MRKIRVLDNVYDLITVNMEDRFKDNVAFRFYDTANDAVTTILYKDYVQDIRKAVNYFQSTIPEIKGKKICLLTKNSYEYAVNTFGVVAAGAVLVLLNQRKSWDELSYELGLVEPDAILTDGDDYGFNDQLKAAYGEILPLHRPRSPDGPDVHLRYHGPQQGRDAEREEFLLGDACPHPDR